MNEQRKKIYVVEDDKNIRVVMELVVKSLHHEVQAFTSGGDGVAAIRSNCPDLIITDYRMPGGMDGVELIRAVRETVSETLPIILISGSIAVLGRLQELLSDLDNIEYISKPFSPRSVAAHIQRMLLTCKHSAVGEENG